MSAVFPDTSAILPDMYSNSSDMSAVFPGTFAIFPDMSRAFPDMSAILRDMYSNSPDMSASAPDMYPVLRDMCPMAQHPHKFKKIKFQTLPAFILRFGKKEVGLWDENEVFLFNFILYYLFYKHFFPNILYLS